MLGLGAQRASHWLFEAMQRRLLFGPSHKDFAGSGRKPFRPWRSRSGELLGYVRTVRQPERTVVVFHGKDGEALDLAWYEQIVEASCTLVLAEYPGYGGRAGRPSEKALLAAAEGLLTEVNSHWSAPVTLLGESLGSSVACYVAACALANVDRLALVSPFTSIHDVLTHHLPFWPERLRVAPSFHSMAHILGLNLPLFIIHGSKDRLVPLRLGRQLYAAYPGTNKTFAELEGFGHADLREPLTRAPEAAAFRQFLVGKA